MAEGTLQITISNQVPVVPPPAFDGTFITGWHVPTKTEFETLKTYLGGEAVAGGKMKVSGIIKWLTPNTGADNSSGFSGIGSGERDWLGAYQAQLELLVLWTKSTIGPNGYTAYLGYDHAAFYTTGAAIFPTGFSLRLLKDDSTDPGTVTDYDGNVYPTVKIGTQVWMDANLATSHYADGTPIPIVTGDAAWAALITAGMCYYNNTP